MRVVDKERAKLLAMFGLCGGLVAGATWGCELIASVDRTLIDGGTPVPTGGSTPTGGAGGAGGAVGGGGAGGIGGSNPYSVAGIAPKPMEYASQSYALPSEDAEPVTLAVEFQWQDVAAPPSGFDISVEFLGLSDPLLQVFSVDSQPFGRTGTRVATLAEQQQYRIEVSRTETAIWAQLVRVVDDQDIVTGPVQAIDGIESDAVVVQTTAESSRVNVVEVSTWQGPGT